MSNDAYTISVPPTDGIFIPHRQVLLGKVMTMIRQRFRPGDWVVFRMTKMSTKPGRRAQNVDPAPNGDYYHYTVDKFWVVVETEQELVTIETRRGKRRTLRMDDDSLRPATWFERFFYSHRFPQTNTVRHAL